MNLNSNVGSRLRKRRKENGVSLRELAEMTGVTASFLSQVEHGKANLSLNSLQRLSEALAVPLLYFLADPPPPSSAPLDEASYIDKPEPDIQQYTPVVRSDNRPRLFLPLSGVTYDLLIPSLGRKMIAILGELAPGMDNIARRLREPTEEFIYVIYGQLLVGLEDKEYILNTGDSIYFEGDKLTSLVCASKDENAVWISVITPSVF